MSHLQVRAAILAALSLSAVAVAVGAAEEAPDFARTLKAVEGSLVRVQASVPVAEGAARSPATFTNTGFLVSDDGFVVTSLLAVAGSSQIRVLRPDGSAAEAQAVAMDQPAGLVLLKADLPDTVPLQFATERPAVGDWVALAFGGRGDAQRADVGAALEPARVAAPDASVHLNGFRWDGLMQVSTRACNGCAASPLLDRQGRVVGVVLAVKCLEPLSSVWQACDAYGLPADQVQAILARMRQGESRRLGWLGVAVADEPGAREGARVAAVLENSPAHTAGIRPGDVVLEINGTAIETPLAVAEIIAQAGPAPGMKLKLLRSGGQIVQVAADLQPRPLAICSAPPQLGAQAPVTLQQLMEENRRLRARVWELEASRQQMENRLRRLGAEPER